jgi:hypothetical protein
MDADRPAEQGKEVVARSHHDELTRMRFGRYLLCLEAEKTVIPPGCFLDDRRLRYFVHIYGGIAMTKIAEYRNNFNRSRLIEMSRHWLFFLT